MLSAACNSESLEKLTVWGDAREGYYFEARRARVVVVADRGTPLSGEQLADYLGADMASRAITDIAAGRAAQYDGTNLNVGGGGMIAFYNRIVPRVARDVVRKLGGAGLVQAGVSTDESTEPWRVVGEAGQVLAVARTQGQALDWLKLFVSRVLRLVPLYLFVMLLLFTTVAVLSGGELHEPARTVAKQALRWLGFTMYGNPPINQVEVTKIVVAGVTWSLFVTGPMLMVALTVAMVGLYGQVTVNDMVKHATRKRLEAESF